MTRKEAIEGLKEFVSEGDVIYGFFRRMSKRKLSQIWSFFVVKDGRIVCLDKFIGELLGLEVVKDGGIRVKGAGFNGGVHVVYTLSEVLYGNGYKLKFKEVKG